MSVVTMRRPDVYHLLPVHHVCNDVCRLLPEHHVCNDVCRLLPEHHVCNDVYHLLPEHHVCNDVRIKFLASGSLILYSLKRPLLSKAHHSA